MSVTPGNDPFSGTNTKNILQHVLSPKIVDTGGGAYAVQLDLINIDNIYLSGLINPKTSVYIAGGLDTTGTIYRSTDGGTTWTLPQTNPFGPNGFVSSIAYNGSRWVAVGRNDLFASATASIMYSDNDGITWTVASNNPFGNGYSGFRVKWNGSYWVASSNFSNITSIAYSYTGDVWYSSTNNVFDSGGVGICSDICWNGFKWVGVGQDVVGSVVQVAISTDGETWRAALNTPLPFTNGYGSCVAWGGNKWVIGGQCVFGGFGTGGLFYSYDGETWTAASGNNPNFARWSTVKWNGSYFLVVGDDYSGNTLVNYSPDGVTWTAVASPPFGGVGFVDDITWNGTKWICTQAYAFSTNNNFAESTDGLNWTTLPAVPFGNDPSLSAVTAIESSTPYWKTTPKTYTELMSKILTSAYSSTSNLI